MSSWLTILLGSLVMALVALVGGITLLLSAAQLQQLLVPLVSLAAGSLLGGALFHMVPEGFVGLAPIEAATWVSAGFTAFLALEIFLHWHHSHRHRASGRGGRFDPKPLPLLILVGDALHNFVGGLGITSTYLIHPAAGLAAWLAAVAHEIPQELGDFGVLLHCGWSARRALFWNVISALTFPLGSLLAWGLQRMIPLAPLVLFAAGNFLYIAASDLVPEIKAQVSLRQATCSFIWFSAGLLLLRMLASA
jgi:zinc and cadmium transporter